jgi:ATP-dependent Clp protease, protease subunit
LILIWEAVFLDLQQNLIFAPSNRNNSKKRMAKPTTYIEASATGKTGTIKLISRISTYSDNSSSLTIKSVVDDFLKTGVSDVEVYINSIGGDCFEATEMCNDLKRLPKVTLKIGAVAASAATYFMTQFPSVAYPNSQIMIHRPKLGTYGDVVIVTADLKLLQNVTDDYKTAYSTKMNKTVDQIESDYFAKGDFWMTANEAKAAGLLDEVLTNNEEVTAENIKVLEAVAAPIIPIINKNNKNMDRLKLIARLKLAADATDVEIEAALASLEAKANKTESLEASAKLATEATVKSLVATAIKEKKITADMEPTYTKLATADFEGTKTILEAMQGAPKLSAELEEGATASGQEKWTMEEYQEKNPEALAKLMTENPKKFAELEAAYFGQ